MKVENHTSMDEDASAGTNTPKPQGVREGPDMGKRQNLSSTSSGEDAGKRIMPQRLRARLPEERQKKKD